MLRNPLSRACLAALAVAALVSGALVTSSGANASPRIDPGFGNGPVRIDPGFSRGPVRVDPGFNRDSGPQYSVKRAGFSGLRANCHWIDRPVNPGAPQPKHPGQNSKVKVCY
jgi:hypothetical protein